MATRYRQEPPFAVQVELAEGCQLWCDHCGLQGIRTQKVKNYRFMKPKTAESIARQMADHGWNSRVEFAMHGEPTMHPEYVKIVGIFREHLPRNQLMMTSNGGGLLRPPGVVSNLFNLFDAGLNVFAFDAYEYVKIKDKVDEALGTDDRHGGALGFEVHRYPDEPEYSPHNRYGKSARLFIRVKDILHAESGTHATINNHCGAGGPGLTEPLQARCAKPFREMSVRWDGNVAICCNDWRGVYKCGNVEKHGLEEVWNGAPFSSARKFLIRKDRGALSPCDVCDAKSYRVGLLPDKKGLATLTRPSAKDREVVRKATAGRPYTKAVVRPWEEKRR